MLPLPLVLIALTAAEPPPVRTLAVTPAAEPRPALRYELLPPLRDKQPGNAALAYLRAFAARPKALNDPAAAQAREKDLTAWEGLPPDRLPRDDVRKRLNEYETLFRELDRAVATTHCDWELFQRIKADGIGAVLIEVQPSREALRYLGLRTRLELAEDRFDDAAKSIRTGLQTAKHVGEAPTLIQLLVGIALEAVTLERVEDWIARPGSPNLYWALTSLPRPVVDPRPGFEGEALFLEAQVPNLAKLRAGPLPKDDGAKVLDGILADLNRRNTPADQPTGVESALGKLGFAGYVAWYFPTARKAMIARGRTAEEVDAMPPAQVVFLDSYEQFLALRDDQWKWLGMPFHLARPALRDVDRRSAKMRADARDPFLVMFTMALPASERVLWAVARTERKVAFLRTVEALRLHAAGHGGTPPAKLADVTAVPVPDDPVTGKPFGYEAKGNVVTLTAAPPDGETADARNSLRYEITFRDAEKK